MAEHETVFVDPGKPRRVVTKEDAACCMAKVDELGRPPIGYCGDDCERRPT